MVKGEDMEEARLIRKLEDDVFIVHFFFECNRLMNIDIEIKDKENVPAVDLDNRAAVSQWCFAIWGAVARAMLRVPEKTLPVAAAKMSITDGATKYECPGCKVPLIEKPPCCGSSKPILRCPKCGVGYKSPEEERKRPGKA